MSLKSLLNSKFKLKNRVMQIQQLDKEQLYKLKNNKIDINVHYNVLKHNPENVKA